MEVSFGLIFFMSNKSRSNLHKGIGASYSVIGSLMLFGLGGFWLDKQSEEGHFWLIIGLLIGVFVGLYELSKFMLKK